jgi:hypothetical protein
LRIQNCVRFVRFPLRHAGNVQRYRHTGWRRQERALVVTADERLLSILELLEECRAGLLAGGNKDSAHLVSVAILDVRMRLHHIGDTELRALCDEMLADDGSARLRDTKLGPGRNRRPLLRLVK